jgi:pyruvate kinase
MTHAPRRTKIIATLGPATDRPGVLEAILREGVDVVRLNLSHGGADDQRRRAREVRHAAAKLGREVGVLADLRGPKIRINQFEHGKVELDAGQHFVLDCSFDAKPGTRERVGVAYLNLYNDVKRGDTLLLDDGLISMRVEDIVGMEIRCVVIAGGTLSDRKGLNRLGGGLSVGALTDRDRADVELAAELGVDFLAVSFARAPEDMHETRALLRKAGSGAAVVAKIERAEALAALGEIIDASDAVMVARGDLGVEIGDAELPGLQKKIIREALARNRAVITATQMLQSMVDSPIPTRAEVLDVANAVIDGTDAVMLSQESAAGKHPEKAVAAMARICLGAERQFEGNEDFALLKPRLERTDQAIALASMFLANRVGVRAIIALTESGATAQWLSRYRSTVPIYGLTRHKFARQRMAMLRDVYPIEFDPHGGNPLHAAKEAVLRLFQLGKLTEGDRVLLTTGDHTGELGGTNTLKLLRVGAGGLAEGLSTL